MMPEKELRFLYPDQQAAGRESDWAWLDRLKAHPDFLQGHTYFNEATPPNNTALYGLSI